MAMAIQHSSFIEDDKATRHFLRDNASEKLRTLMSRLHYLLRQFPMLFLQTPHACTIKSITSLEDSKSRLI